MAQKKAIISCYAQTDPHTASRLFNNQTEMKTKVVTLRGKDLGKKVSKTPGQPSLPQVSYDNSDNTTHTNRGIDMTIFSDRLLLLLHTLFSLSKDASDSVFRTKCEKHLHDEWFQRPIILQCCMETNVNLHNKLVSCISLSDNGSTLSFCPLVSSRNISCPVWVYGEATYKL